MSRKISETIIRILYGEKYQTIKEMEILTIVKENKATYKLSNGVTVSKESLFPYHHSKFYCRGEEYYFAENIML